MDGVVEGKATCQGRKQSGECDGSFMYVSKPVLPAISSLTEKSVSWAFAYMGILERRVRFSVSQSGHLTAKMAVVPHRNLG
jgi:hypothetical protein